MSLTLCIRGDWAVQTRIIFDMTELTFLLSILRLLCGVAGELSSTWWFRNPDFFCLLVPSCPSCLPPSSWAVEGERGCERDSHFLKTLARTGAIFLFIFPCWGPSGRAISAQEEKKMRHAPIRQVFPQTPAAEMEHLDQAEPKPQSSSRKNKNHTNPPSPSTRGQFCLQF